MPELRRRAKKLVRKRHKKTIKPSDVDKIWKDYVEYGIVRPLIRYGRVDVDDRMMFEIVGKNVLDKPKMIAMLNAGKSVKKGGVVSDLSSFKLTRNGVIYNIRLTDKNKKSGKLIFQPCQEFSKAVHLAVLNPANNYRIEK